MPTLLEIGEFEAIRRLTLARARSKPDSGLVLGPGDDAAVLRPSAGHDLVATTDSFVEHRHFTPAWFGARDLGRRLAVACASDIAAMGGAPRWALHSLAVRPDHDVDALLELQGAIAAFLDEHGASIVGGNLVAVEGPESMTLTVLGEVRGGRAWTRAGARAGDAIAVTGRPGAAAAGRLLAERLGDTARRPEWEPLLRRWIAPESRIALARSLAEGSAVRAAIDVSDGLAADLDHLGEASGLGAELEAETLFAFSDLSAAADRLGVSIESLVLGPSDDYELILAVDPEAITLVRGAAEEAQVPLAFVGRMVTGSPGVVLRMPDGSRRPLEAEGWDHFAN